jgi:hypothetical protein
MKRSTKKFNKIISNKLCNVRNYKGFINERTVNYDDLVTELVESTIWDIIDVTIQDISSKIRTNREVMGLKYHLGVSRNFDRLLVTERILNEL